MSETPQGPGWWLASDGRYYPPQGESTKPMPQGSGQDQHSYQQPGSGRLPQYQPPQPAQPQYQQPPYGSPQQTRPPTHQPPAPYRPPGFRPSSAGRAAGRGCLVTLFIVVVLLAGAVLAGRWAWGRFTGWVGAKTDGIVGGVGCPFATDAEVGALVGGGSVRLVKAGSLTSIVSSVVDSRVIPDAPSCWGVSDGSAPSVDSTRLLRIASQTSTQAAAAFRDEVTKAKGAAATNGNGASASGPPYYNKAVTGIGDEAFCTSASTTGPGSAGILVRKGDRLVYVSVTPSFAKGAPGLGTPGRTTFSTDDESCALAQKIAGTVLTHGT